MRITANRAVFCPKEFRMTYEAILDAATLWHVRLGGLDASDGDWSAFTDWLEADPAHGEAYDIVALADTAYSYALVEGRQVTALAANDNDGLVWYQRRRVLAIAASAIFALVATPMFFGGRDLQSFETKPGETRMIALNDGSRIELNGGTRLELDRSDERYAKLLGGEAAFTIRHDAANPFTLETGDSQLVDVGTVFNVRRGENGLELSVGEGAVRYNPDDEALLVNAGYQLNVAQHQSKPLLSATDPQGVGGWRSGKLVYRNATPERIALDLSRRFGTQIRVDPNLSKKRFSGIIQVGQNQATAMHTVERLLGAKVRPTSGGWLLTN
jgi:transmembrane sensor